MKKRLFISLMTFVLMLALNLSAQGGTSIEQLTSNTYADKFPRIKGNYLVWQGYVEGDWEIFLCDLTTPTRSTIRITDNDYNDTSPQTDGEYVVWMGCINSDSEIFLYNIASGQVSQITDDNNVDSSPQIADGRVVWTSHEVTTSIEPGEIILYNIGTGQSEQLTTNTLDDSFLRINSETVLWVQTDDEDNSTLLTHDLSGGTTQEAPEGFIWEDSPQTDGDLTVSMRNDGNWEIVIRSEGQNGFEQITNNTINDRYPRISGNKITWMGGEGQASEIYLALSASGCKGDFDNDGDVDGSDLAIFAADFGRTDCASAPLCEGDFDGDDDVDGSDLAVFAADFGRTDCHD